MDHSYSNKSEFHLHKYLHDHTNMIQPHNQL